VLKRQRPIAAHHFHLPTRTELDMRLIIGPALFGVGWGIAGFCPGPAFTALGLGSLSTLIFVIPMLLGAYGARTLALHTDAKRKMAHETINNTQ
jgi:uncharacterized membrane protein YedE/YeeE